MWVVASFQWESSPIKQTSFHQVDPLSNFLIIIFFQQFQMNHSYSKPVIVCCCCSGKKKKKRCNYLRQCEQICGSPFWGMGGKGSGALSFHHSSSDARLDLWLDSVSFLNIASKWSIFELFTRTSLLWIHQWVFMKLQPAPLLCTDSEVNLNSLSQRVHGKNDLMSPFLSIAVSFSWLWNDGFHIFNALLLRARKPLLSFTEQ